MATKFDKNDETNFRLATDGLLDFTRHYEPLTDREIEKYQKEEYPQWLQNIKEFYESISRKLEEPSCKSNLSISIRNKGSVPAENLLVEFTLVGGLLFLLPSDKDIKLNEKFVPKIPTPPPIPRGRWVQGATIGRFIGIEQPDMPFLGKLGGTPERDRHGFYWKHGRLNRISDSLTFECDEFRHQVEPKIFNMLLFVPANNIIEKGALKCRITAKNLPQPVEYVLPVKVNYTKRNTFDQAMRLVNPFYSQT